ncbi:MAG: hypothetical protein AAFP77_05290 [Bacteroidota bacterium]
MKKALRLSFSLSAMLFYLSLYAQQLVRIEFDQEERIITINDFYRCESKIFPASTGMEFFSDRGLDGTGTILSIEDVLETENIVDSLFNYTYSSDPRVKEYQPRNYSRHFRYYRRQYLGFRDSSGDTLVAVQYINFKDRRAKEKFLDWEHKFSIGFGNWYELNTFILIVNITDQNVRIP